MPASSVSKPSGCTAPCEIIAMRSRAVIFCTPSMVGASSSAKWWTRRRSKSASVSFAVVRTAVATVASVRVAVRSAKPAALLRYTIRPSESSPAAAAVMKSATSMRVMAAERDACVLDRKMSTPVAVMKRATKTKNQRRGSNGISLLSGRSGLSLQRRICFWARGISPSKRCASHIWKRDFRAMFAQHTCRVRVARRTSMVAIAPQLRKMLKLFFVNFLGISQQH